MTIYQEIKATGTTIKNWQSDLYIPINEITTPIVNKYKKDLYITTFTNQVEGGQWYDIAFAYDPYWERIGM
jgi:hypothetical protein